MNTTLEEHYVMVGEPEGFYHDHFSPPNSKGQTLALHIHSAFKDTKLEQKLAFIDSDGTPFITGHTNESIATFNLLLKRLLQWIICLLHYVDLLLRHVFTALDVSPASPDSFGGTIGKKVEKRVFTWTIKDIVYILNQLFLYLLLLLSAFPFSQGWPQRIIILHIFLSSTSVSFTPTSSISSFTASKNLLFGLPLLLFPGNSISIIFLPTYSWSLLMTCPYHLSLPSLIFIPNCSTSTVLLMCSQKNLHKNSSKKPCYHG